MPTCPNGHQSGSDDWCEVCGHRMAGAVPPPPPPPPAAGYGYPPPPPGQDPGFPQPAPPRPHLAAVPDPAPEGELCPQCRTPREANAPFCEECRWNFLTNTATSYTPAAPNPPLPGTHGGPGPGMQPPGPNPAQQFQPPPGPGYDYQGSRPSQMNRPAEPIPPFGNGGAHGGGNGGGPGNGFGQPGPGQPGPGQTPPGAPQAFQQPGPPPPPAFPQAPQETGGPQGPPPPPPGPQGPGPAGPGPGPGPGQPGPGQPGPGGPSFGGGGDDWVISPPSAPARQDPFQQGPPQPQDPFQQGPPPQQDPFQQGPPPQQGPGTWTATIGPDREYFMAMMQRSGPEASGLNLPAYSPEQQRPLVGNQITIGRRRHSTGDTPDIDLSVPPEDPGVSHQHAVLVQQPDSSWAVVDQNSTNGTTVNNGEEPIQPFVPIPLQDGDRVHVGAWTTITIRRD
ncbi:FHA domain-containing protein [Streptomyces kanamyceticus]|uniref:FHA domain-containing protein n=2 Tax=Streptomyces kanamyceticus TaxID=1967 RepID=A0A5J6GJP7_STRKN|nr:FHA domain-containing protein [Streptomyces kanamyceticus]QEU94321.1 FHA domain-containing protein [Streptomyces kanamyceticus]